MASEAEVVFVLGGPGAGKGTQCEKISKEYGIVHLSAGDLLRRERVTPGSKNGELIERYIRDGKIVPVEITVSLLKAEMETEVRKGRRVFLIDGFPRNTDNVQGWNKVMGNYADIRFVLFLDCPEDVMEKRLLKRGETSGRSDDNIESIRKRFKTYQGESYPIIQHFEKLGKVRQLVSVGDVNDIYSKVRKVFTTEFPTKLVCKCGHEEVVPRCCKQDMHIEENNGKPVLSCWMGVSCGSAPLPSHCGVPMHTEIRPSWTRNTPGGGGGVSEEDRKKRLAQIKALDEADEKRAMKLGLIIVPAFIGSGMGALESFKRSSWRSHRSPPRFGSLRFPLPLRPNRVGILTASATATASFLAFGITRGFSRIP